MKHFIYKSIVLLLTVSICCSCKPKITVPSPSKGNIDPTRYVAVGNSITSGYADGALSYNGQIVSYPNLIAGQLKLVGGGNFTQPLMPQGSIGCGTADSSGQIIFTAPFKLDYSTDCLGVNSLGPIPSAGSGDKNALLTSISSQGPFNNMGVPGAKVITALAPGYGNPANGTGKYNPFFTRMAKDVTSSSMISDAMLLNPTFFSLFLGNNDVLLYATNGGASDSITPPSGSAGVGFDGSINAIVSTLTSGGAKGVIGNIPDITALPYFTTVPWNGLTLRQGQADTLNGVVPFLGITYVFKAGANPFVIYDASVNTPSHARVIQQGELVLLDVPLDQIKCHKMGTLIPIPNQYVLTATEIQNIKTATSAYNASIQSVAQAKGLAFVDVNAFLSQTQKGISYDGISLNAQFVTGGAFSLDGIHLNPIGNALLANEFIKAINNTYSSSIPQVDATKYRGILFP